MIKEISIAKEEFTDIFPKLDPIWFSHYHTSALFPYFKMKNGKKIVIDTLRILFNDRKNENTILHPKQGAFKTQMQEKYGSDFKYLIYSDLTIGDFRNPHNNLDFLNYHKFFPIFESQENFDIFIQWLDKRYVFLSNIQKYNDKEITLKMLRKDFI